MQPAIHQEKNPDIYRFDVRLFVAMYCGLHLLFIIPRESPCIFDSVVCAIGIVGCGKKNQK
jgi:hypothetical protein